MSMSVEMILRLIDQATGPLRGVSREVDHLKHETAALNAQQAKGAGVLKAEAAALNAQRMAGGVKASVWFQHQKQMEGATKAAETHRKSMIGVGSTVGMIGGVAAAYAATEVASYGFEQAISFEKEMANVRKKVTLDQGATWTDVERMINRASTELGVNRMEMAQLAAAAGQAGIQYKDLGEFMNLAASAASAWDMAPKEAAQRLAEIKSATQMSLPQMRDFADKVNALGDNSAASERDLISMFQRTAAASQAANVPLDTSLAVLTALKSTGMREEKAATFLNSFVSTLRTAGEGGRGAKQAAEGYKALGLTAKQVSEGMKNAPTQTILDLLDRLQKSPNAAFAGVRIFGKEFWDEAVAGGKSLDEIRKNLELIFSGKYKGSLGENLAKDLDTAANHLQRFKNLTSEIGDELTRGFLPSINQGIEGALNAYRTYQDKAAAREKEMREHAKGESSDALERRLQGNRATVPPPPRFIGTDIYGAGRNASYRGGFADGAGVHAAGWAHGGFSAPRALPGGEAMPTFANMAGSGLLLPGAVINVKTDVDTSKMDDAKHKASATADEIQRALGGVRVTPDVDPSKIEAAQKAAAQLLGTLNAIGEAAGSAVSKANAAAGAAGKAASAANGTLAGARGVAPGRGTLHDGPEGGH